MALVSYTWRKKNFTPVEIAKHEANIEWLSNKGVDLKIDEQKHAQNAEAVKTSRQQKVNARMRGRGSRHSQFHRPPHIEAALTGGQTSTALGDRTNAGAYGACTPTPHPGVPRIARSTSYLGAPQGTHPFAPTIPHPGAGAQ